MTYSEHELEFTFANKTESESESLSFNLTERAVYAQSRVVLLVRLFVVVVVLLQVKSLFMKLKICNCKLFSYRQSNRVVFVLFCIIFVLMYIFVF